MREKSFFAYRGRFTIGGDNGPIIGRWYDKAPLRHYERAKKKKKIGGRKGPTLCPGGQQRGK